MFAGIVEAQSRVLDFTAVDSASDLAHLVLEKPPEFNDIQIGDSIAVDGVCLTAESTGADGRLDFSLGRETLRITGWTAESLKGRTMNLERSLKFGDRVHGHFVSGHVDARVPLLRKSGEGSVDIQIQLPPELKSFVYKKGSIAVNGVSLTVNDVSADGVISICLIPETLKRTNLGVLKPGDLVNIEVDQFIRAVRRQLSEMQL